MSRDIVWPSDDAQWLSRSLEDMVEEPLNRIADALEKLVQLAEQSATRQAPDRGGNPGVECRCGNCLGYRLGGNALLPPGAPG